MSTSFEDLEVWKKSCRLTVRIYRMLKSCRDYGMKDQMLRASVSIASNVAEGSERKTIADFQRFIDYAKGSAAELRTQVYIAREVEIFNSTDAKELIEELKSISRMLQALGDSIDKTVNCKP
jgi:four helix bundle protein